MGNDFKNDMGLGHVRLHGFRNSDRNALQHLAAAEYCSIHCLRCAEDILPFPLGMFAYLKQHFAAIFASFSCGIFCFAFLFEMVASVFAPMEPNTPALAHTHTDSHAHRHTQSHCKLY